MTFFGLRFTLVLIICLAASTAQADQLPDTPKEQGAARQAARAGILYLQANQPLNVDEMWFAYRAAMRLGGAALTWAESIQFHHLSKATRDKIGKILWSSKNHMPLNFPLMHPPAAAPPKAGTAKLSEEDVALLLALTLEAAECIYDSSKAPGALVELIRQPDSGGYLLTHQLGYLVTAKAGGCLSSVDIEADRLRLAAGVYQELNTPFTSNDLNLERIAVLCYAGLSSWIAEDVWREVLKAQNADGSWSHRTGGAFGRDQHSTALAAYALTWAGD